MSYQIDYDHKIFGTYLNIINLDLPKDIINKIYRIIYVSTYNIIKSKLHRMMELFSPDEKDVAKNGEVFYGRYGDFYRKCWGFHNKCGIIPLNQEIKTLAISKYESTHEQYIQSTFEDVIGYIIVIFDVHLLYSSEYGKIWLKHIRRYANEISFILIGEEDVLEREELIFEPKFTIRVF